ncbi:protein serine/threonine kinase, putative [Entamoeba invadens IP1]|uniref:protein serine/threonine kinase, putative n=1 Tax=Entamoeba invadens IP1 TaxID=370355 RepID=UPI0002C3E377|nr:protein serine/threonine kinase, putative [Entamoeba invadens IP1]ELP93782.1 protein serine/threonine kinase, putative [Entamoeba invadens IP1]|eukprot:XP_004260553.1 protein serine/threonine kinase, putative [Entamoeba invadens IP1]
MVLFIVFFLQVVCGEMCWSVTGDNDITWGQYYSNMCNNFEGVTMEYDKGTLIDKFTFTSKCCGNGKDYYSVSPYSNEAEKLAQFSDGSTIKVLTFNPSQPGKHYSLHLKNIREGFVGIINRKQKPNDYINDNIYVYDQPAVIMSTGEERFYIKYTSQQSRPYIYLEITQTGKLNQLYINDNLMCDKCAYAFNANQNVEINNMTNYNVFKVCTKRNLSRYITCPKNQKFVNDCSCYINSDYSTASMKSFGTNYPDCLYNNTLFDFTIKSGHNEVLFDSEKGNVWTSLLFQSRTSEVKIVITNNLEFTETTTLPENAVKFEGRVKFSYLIIKSKPISGVYNLNDWTINKIVVENFGINDVIFVGKNKDDIPNGIEATCVNGNNTRYGVIGSVVKCGCESSDNEYNHNDCTLNSKDKNNIMRLKIQSGIYSKGAVFWNSLEVLNGVTLEGTVTAKFCELSGNVTLDGTLSCEQIMFSGDSFLLLINKAVIGAYQLNSNGYNVTIIGGISGQTMTINKMFINNTLIIKNLRGSFEEVQLESGSTFVNEQSVLIKTLVVNGISKIESKSIVTVLNCQNEYKIDITASTLLWYPNIIFFGKVSLDNPFTIETTITKIIIEEVVKQMSTNNEKKTFLNLIPSYNVIEMNVPITKLMSVVYYTSCKTRPIKFLNEPYYICDRQIVVLKSVGDESCEALGYKVKVCVPQNNGKYLDDKGVYDYSCPCYNSPSITRTLVIENVTTYQLQTEEFYTQIIINKNVLLESTQKEMVVISNFNFHIKGDQNLIYVFLKNNQPIEIDVENNNLLFAGDSYGLTNTDDKIDLSQNGLCKAGLYNGSGFYCEECRFGKVDDMCSEMIDTISNCDIYSVDKATCIRCQENYYTNKTHCLSCGENCKWCRSNSVCDICEEDYILDNNTCVNSKSVNCDFATSNVCLKCSSNHLWESTQSKCVAECGEGCFKCSSPDNCDFCDISVGYTQNTSSTLCEFVDNFKKVTQNKVLECLEHYYGINNKCIFCSNGCEKCYFDITTKTEKCLLCSSDNVLNSLGSCVDTYSSKCMHSINNTCAQCPQGMYFNGEACEYCTPNCSSCGADGECFGCLKDYVLVKKLPTNKGVCVLPSQQEGTHCLLYENGHCRLCENSYFLNSSNECTKCYYMCSQCSKTATSCDECVEGFVLQNGVCETSKTALQGCQQTIPYSLKCAVCERGYYLDLTQRSCKKCITNCALCTGDSICVICDEYYFVNDNNTCQAQTDLIGCFSFQVDGCETCLPNYYLHEKHCVLCSESTEHCVACDQYTASCQSCEDNYILKNHSCVYYTTVLHCTGSSNSKCSGCSFWYEVGQDFTSCETKAVWWVLLLVVLCALFIVVVLMVSFVGITIWIVYAISQKHDEINERKKYAHFKLSQTNITWSHVDGKTPILMDKRILFNEEGELPILKPTRVLFCVANYKNHNIRISLPDEDFSNENYKIKFVPSKMTLKGKEGCEVEVYLEPQCSTHIQGKTQMIIDDLKNGKRYIEALCIDALTEVSSRLDSDEIIIEKQIGKGSFGIVYVGLYKGNKVAIKKMKKIQMVDAMMKEFEKEVAMLDKFRNEYIVHFYGAVLIPNKICMVTEFAEYGSLQDIIVKRKKEEVSTKVKFKFVIDSAKGIEYLHSNGIMHRDIKPDNVLIFSLETDVDINAKLTDFGSSRNINAMMTNMSFTQGVGTPIYMSPEVLRKEKYKIAADVYSFAVTMFNVMVWDAPYQGSLFKYPWNIANFVADGGRLSKPDTMSDEMFDLISDAWKQDPKQRLTIVEMLKRLETLYSNI